MFYENVFFFFLFSFSFSLSPLFRSLELSALTMHCFSFGLYHVPFPSPCSILLTRCPHYIQQLSLSHSHTHTIHIFSVVFLFFSSFLLLSSSFRISSQAYFNVAHLMVSSLFFPPSPILPNVPMSLYHVPSIRNIMHWSVLRI